MSDIHSPLSSFLDESAGLGRIAKPVNELKLRCTEFDENGRVTLVNGEFKKSELIAKVLYFPFISPIDGTCGHGYRGTTMLSNAYEYSMASCLAI